MSLSVAFITSSFIIFPVQERVTKAKLVSERPTLAESALKLCCTTTRFRNLTCGPLSKLGWKGVEESSLSSSRIKFLTVGTRLYFCDLLDSILQSVCQVVLELTERKGRRRSLIETARFKSGDIFQMQLMTGVNKFIYFISSIVYDIQLHLLCSLLVLATLLAANPDGVYTHYADTSCKFRFAPLVTDILSRLLKFRNAS